LRQSGSVEMNTIIKRDERVVPFDDSKITDVIFKAFAATTGAGDRSQAMELTLEVLKKLKTEYGDKPFTVENVQDLVELVLIEQGHALVAKAFILYRNKRSNLREARSELMDAVAEILKENSRDNANVGNSPSAKVLQISEVASKNYYLKRVLPPDEAAAHEEGDIHIHDLDFLTLTTTCCQIDLDKLFTGGFGTGHGALREPNDIQSYSALACIAIQSNQSDQHGGQSIPNFDYALSKGVAKTYKKLYRQYLFRANRLRRYREFLHRRSSVRARVNRRYKTSDKNRRKSDNHT